MGQTADQRLRRINSRQNSLVRELRAAFHNSELTEDGCCAIEGVRVIEEATRSGLRFRAIFFAESAGARVERLLPQISSHAEAVLLPDHIFRGAVATESPQGVAALVRWPQHDRERVLSTPDALLVGAAGIQDPGNLGTIIRSAEAFAANAVLLGENTVNEFNSKLIRASAGSAFRVPLLHLSALEIPALRDRKIRFVATSSHKGTPIDEADLTGPLLLLIGNEGAGLPGSYTSVIDELVRIPQVERVESLNAGVAASIILYEAARQRRVAR